MQIRNLHRNFLAFLTQVQVGSGIKKWLMGVVSDTSGLDIIMSGNLNGSCKGGWLDTW